MEDSKGGCYSWTVSTDFTRLLSTVVGGTDKEIRIDVVEIDEPCSHEIQFGGMCAECGKDMTA